LKKLSCISLLSILLTVEATEALILIDADNPYHFVQRRGEYPNYTYEPFFLIGKTAMGLMDSNVIENTRKSDINDADNLRFNATF
jgi:hypothetical protein